MENKNPIVTIEMENGKKIVAELYPHIAPNTVKNFVTLVNQGFYNGVGFHRVIEGFMIQEMCIRDRDCTDNQDVGLEAATHLKSA